MLFQNDQNTYLFQRIRMRVLFALQKLFSQCLPCKTFLLLLRSFYNVAQHFANAFTNRSSDPLVLSLSE
jgi:hypothetical protein